MITAFQHPSFLPLMTEHNFTMGRGETTSHYFKSVSVGGPTLNSIFNSRGGP